MLYGKGWLGRCGEEEEILVGKQHNGERVSIYGEKRGHGKVAIESNMDARKVVGEMTGGLVGDS